MTPAQHSRLMASIFVCHDGRRFTAVALTALLAVSLLGFAGCEERTDGTTIIRIGGRTFKIRGTQSPWAMKRSSDKQERVAKAAGHDLRAEARERRSLERERVRSPRPDEVPAAPWVDLHTLNRRTKADRAYAKGLMHRVFRCQVMQAFTRERVGDKVSAPGQKFLGRRRVGLRYAELGCQESKRQKRMVEIVAFVTKSQALSIHWLYAGGVANVELIGQTKKQTFGLITGFVHGRRPQ